jgi:hypothetical protein
VQRGVVAVWEKKMVLAAEGRHRQEGGAMETAVKRRGVCSQRSRWVDGGEVALSDAVTGWKNEGERARVRWWLNGVYRQLAGHSSSFLPALLGNAMQVKTGRHETAGQVTRSRKR